MKKSRRNHEVNDLRPEYDFSRGVRGKYYKRYVAGTNVVLLAPDVLKVFPNSAAVNRALRSVIAARARRRRRAP